MPDYAAGSISVEALVALGYCDPLRNRPPHKQVAVAVERCDCKPMGPGGEHDQTRTMRSWRTTRSARRMRHQAG